MFYINLPERVEVERRAIIKSSLVYHNLQCETQSLQQRHLKRKTFPYNFHSFHSLNIACTSCEDKVSISVSKIKFLNKIICIKFEKILDCKNAFFLHLISSWKLFNIHLIYMKIQNQHQEIIFTQTLSLTSPIPVVQCAYEATKMLHYVCILCEQRAEEFPYQAIWGMIAYANVILHGCGIWHRV